MSYWETLKNYIQTLLSSSSDDTDKAEDSDAKEASRSAILLLLFIPLMCMAMFCASQIAFLLAVPGTIPQRIAALATANYSPWEYEQFQIISPRIETEVFLDQAPIGNPATQTQMAGTAAAIATEGLVVQPFGSSVPTDNLTSVMTVTPTSTELITSTATETPTGTTTATATETLTPSQTFTPSITPTSSITPTITETETPTPTATLTPTVDALVVAAPSANFSVVTSGLSVTMTNTSSGSITGYSWSFGDGIGTSSVSNPGTYTYATGGTYTISLTVTGAGGVDTFSVIVNVGVPSTDLSFALTSSNTTPQVGQTFTVTARISNLTAITATGVTANLSFGTGLSYQSFTGTGSFDGSLWTVGTVSANSSVSITMTVRADTANTSPSVSGNLASVTPADSNSGNNSSSVTINIQAVPVTSADLTMSMTTSTSNLIIGDTFTYTLTATNNGTINATGVVISQTLPTGIAFVSSADCTASGQSLTCTVGALSAGTAQTATVQAQANQIGTFSSTASVNGTQADNNTANDSASASVTVTNEVDLTLAMGVSSTTPPERGTVTYDVTLTNNGPATATNIGIDITLPSGVTFVLASPASGTYASTTGRWTVNTLASGTSTTLNITVTVNSGTAGTTLTASSATATLTQTDTTPASSAVDITPTATATTINLNTSLSGATGSINAPNSLTYTATITNQGTSTATNVSALLTLTPSSLSVSSSSGNGTFDTTTNTWTIGSLIPGQSATYAFTFSVPTSLRGQTITTEVSLASFDQADVDTTNNVDSLSVSVLNPGLSLSKTRDARLVSIGGTRTFTIQLSNQDVIDYTGVVVTDNLPAGVTFDSYTADQGTYNPVNGEWDVGNISSGTTLTLRITVTVDLDQAGNSIVNTATITSQSPTDPDTSDNSDSININVRDSLSLNKSLLLGSGQPLEGAQITYRLSLSNNDVIGYTDVRVFDELPVGVTYVSHTASQGTYNLIPGDADENVWVVGTLTVGTVATLDITVTVDAGTGGTTITNDAAVIQTVPTAPPDADLSGSQSITPVNGQLSLNKNLSSGSTQPAEGSQITYRLTLRNDDVIDYTDVRVFDELPVGVTYVSHTASQGTYNLIPGDADENVWVVGTLTVGTVATLDITVTVDTGTGGTRITNTANITQTIPTAPAEADLTGSQFIDPVATGVNVSLDLDSGFATDPASYNVGDVVTVQFNLRNDGPETATNVVAVLDDIPDFTYLSTTNLPSGASYDEVTRTLTIPSISSGQTRNVNINFTVNASAAGMSVSATGNIISVDQTNNSTNLTGSETYLINGTDLAINKTVDNTTPFEGQTITYTVTVSNTGQDTTAVEVTDQLPIGVTYVSHTTATGTYDTATGIWAVGDMTTGTSAQLDIVAIVDVGTAGGTVTNTADITNFTLYEIDLNNNSASADINPQGGFVDLALSKVSSANAVVLTDTFDYTITVTNNGTLSATTVNITDTLPTEVTFLSSASCTHNTGTVTCAVGTVAAGASQSVTITVEANAIGDPVTNSATVSLTETDADTSNNTASVDVTIAPQNLNAVSLCSPDPANFMRWRIDNPNPTTITFDWVIFGTTETGSNTVPAASGGTPGQLIFTTQTQTSNTLIVSVDGVQNDTVASGMTTCDIDLGVSLTVDNATPYAQQTVQYTLTLTNNNPTHTASDIVVDVFLPLGAIIENNTPSVGAWSAPQWTVDTLASGASATLVLDVTVVGNDGDTLTTSASISSALQPDANTSNNTAFADVTITQLTEDLEMTAFVFDPTTILEGGATAIDITVQNLSTTTAIPNVSIPNLVPAELSYDSTDTITAGTFDSATNVWSVGTLAAGGTANLRLLVSDNTPNNTVTTTLTVNSPSNDDPTPTNNALSATVTIAPLLPDIVVNKTAPTPITDGTEFNFTIEVRNTGTIDATNVLLEDILPSNMSFVSASGTLGTTTCTENSGTVTCNIGTLTVGAVETITLRVLPTLSDPTVEEIVTNTASVTLTETDATPADNSSSVTVTVETQ